ncbi:MAG: outer membrane beta-barrel protein [Xanthobacteraceae bacterium]
MIAALMAVATGGSAAAADISVPYKAPPPSGCASANWNGFYVGINGGGAMDRSTLTDLGNAVVAFNGSAVGTQTVTASGGFVGGTAGYNFQRCLTFWGIEADWDWSSLRNSYGVNPIAIGNDNYTVSDNTNWFGTARFRTGVALENLLLYVTGGAAWANINHAVAPNPAVFPVGSLPIGFNDTVDQWGWAAGAGAEWSFTSNLSLKSEVLVLGFPDQSHVIDFSPRYGAGQLDNFKSSDEIFVFRTGLNWRFGG